MTYADLLERPNVSSHYLIVMKPSRRIASASWSNVSGTRYTSSFTYGYVTDLKGGISPLTEASDSTLSDGEWYYEHSTQTIYFDNGLNNPASAFIAAEYEVHIGTKNKNWHRIPDDTSSIQVPFLGCISSSFSIRQSVSDNLFGFLPTQSAKLDLINIDDFLTEHLYGSSFNQAEINIYHYLNKLSTANLDHVFKGVMGNASLNENEINFKLYDDYKIFDKDFEPQYDRKYFTSSTYSNLDPTHENRPIRQLYGRIEGFIPTNIDYELDNPTTSNNRIWAVGSVPSDNKTQATVDTGSTSASTVLASTPYGMDAGDTIKNNDTGEYNLIIGHASSGVITHSSWTTSTSGDVIERGGVSSVVIVQQGAKYQCYYDRDYTVSISNGVMLFTFKSGMETNVGLPNTLSPLDTVYCTVYGRKSDVTYGSDSDLLNVLANPVGIIYDILVNIAGVSSSDIDTTSFTSVNNDLSDYKEDISLAIPEQSGLAFPSIRDVLAKILSSHFLRLYKNVDNKWALSQKLPLSHASSTDQNIDESEIFEGSIRYEFDYSEILSKAVCRYRFREVNKNGSLTNDSWSYESHTSDMAQYVHGVTKEKTFNTVLYGKAHSGDGLTLAEIYARRMAFYFGDRIGKIDLKAPLKFRRREIGDSLTIKRERIPGFKKTSGTTRERDVDITGFSKSKSTVELELDDQKGMEDNQGSWLEG